MRAIMNDGGPLIITPTCDYLLWGGDEIEGNYGTVLEDYEAICIGSETASKEAEFLKTRGRTVLTFGTQHLHQAFFYYDREHLYALGCVYGDLSDQAIFQLTSSNTDWEDIGLLSLTSPSLILMHGAFGGGEISLLDSKIDDTQKIEIVPMQYGLLVDLAVGEYSCEFWQYNSDRGRFIAVRFRRV